LELKNTSDLGLGILIQGNMSKLQKQIVSSSVIMSREEACWTHIPEARGSKPRSASSFFLLVRLFVCFENRLIDVSAAIAQRHKRFFFQ